MSGVFTGEVTEYYQRFRPGYPEAVFDALADTFGLTNDDVVLDLGCGTGQLTRPMAPRVRTVLGMDPSADMLSQARRVTDAPNVAWLLGADTDVPTLGPLLGTDRLGVVTIGQALHWMDHETLFAALPPLLRPGGGVAVVTNGEPLWLQDRPWSQVLRELLEDWLGQHLTHTCGTDQESQRRYEAALVAAGYKTDVQIFGKTTNLAPDAIIGGLFSAMSAEQLPAKDEREAFVDRVRRALEPHAPYTERARVTLLTGRRSDDTPS